MKQIINILLMLVLSTTIVSIAYAQKKYMLTIEAIPFDSRIRIMNIKPKYHPGIELVPGSYDVFVTKKGYKDYRKWIKIDNRDVKFQVRLEKEEKRYFYSHDNIIEWKQELHKNLKIKNIDKFVGYLKSKNKTVRWDSIWALGEMRDPRAVEHLINALNNERDTFTAGHILGSLGKINDSRAIAALNDALKHKDPSVQRVAEITLMEITQKSKAKNWKLIDEIDGDPSYIDTNSVSFSKNIIKVWRRYEITWPKGFPIPYDHTESLDEIDCLNNKFRYLTQIDYEKDGTIFDFTEVPTKWETFSSGSVYSLLCKKIPEFVSQNNIDDKKSVVKKPQTELEARELAESKLKSLNIEGDLIAVAPSHLQIAQRSDGRLYFNILKWSFIFRDKKVVNKSIIIEVEIKKEKDVFNERLSVSTNTNVPYRPKDYFDKPITDWNIDCEKAMGISEKEGGIQTQRPPISLKMREVDEKIVPVWILPYFYNDFIFRGVRADNGRIVYAIKNKSETLIRVRKGELGILAIDKWTEKLNHKDIEYGHPHLLPLPIPSLSH